MVALTNETSQYLSVLHTGEDKAKLVKRIHYVTFVGMLRAISLRVCAWVTRRRNAASAANGS